MKRAIALICAVVFITLIFSGCKKDIITDRHGVTHKVEMKHGEFLQDKYGNLIEKCTNENGEEQQDVVFFPVVVKTGKRVIENAFLKMKIPEGWNFNENINVFRIQHKECPDEITCEVTVDVTDEYDLKSLYARDLAAKQIIAEATGDTEAATDFKTLDGKIFGKETMGFTCKLYDDSTFYYYAFSYSNQIISFSIIMNNQCIKSGFDPKEFITENVTLKKIPTE